MSFDKHSLLITVDHFLSKMYSLDSKDEYQNKCPLRKLSSEYPIQIVYSNQINPTKNNNRKIIEYFGNDITREKNISKNDLLNKLTTDEDNDNNTVHSNIYLDKNQKWLRTSGKNIDDLI